MYSSAVKTQDPQDHPEVQVREPRARKEIRGRQVRSSLTEGSEVKVRRTKAAL